MKLGHLILEELEELEESNPTGKILYRRCSHNQWHIMSKNIPEKLLPAAVHPS